MNPSLRQGRLAWIGLFGGLALTVSACGDSAEQPTDQQGSLEPTQQESTAAIEQPATGDATQQQ